ncbi:MAG: DUF309 domain-containing protein [Vampirovibrionales bacterium]|nr:DUF309 domain-containing protein [Vampirovibrionales bacterium]
MHITPESLSLRQRFLAGARLFDAAEYFAAHDYWEASLWPDLPAQSPQKRWIQGWIQLAVGLCHWQRGNMVGAHRVGQRGLAQLRASCTSEVLQTFGVGNAEASNLAALWAEISAVLPPEIEPVSRELAERQTIPVFRAICQRKTD